ncbi:hypothetical protein COCMIDRAFT_840 [Bipolaris oryzae ATCC 44560]|uniref:Uncharacterized protein n=1 Tax=Bipolaris oryzae ATCC 44560 TaxID=930090 RepID=W6ZJY9_COCMI|nr:uncharacterized protein COCMIDRAFT_840 [Bipolaris oryzae ATCC 44560]EUC50380.1 hypothetical protein COCMIDRAFT_840 [Bipolaris oryzae ATCC 44560]
MTSDIDRWEFPSNLLRLSKQILASMTGTQSPVKQTFLLSPTPSEESFRPDSPILQPFYGGDALRTANTSDISLYSPSTSTGSIRENDRGTWRSADARMSDILPDDVDLYAEPEPHVHEEITETHGRQHQSVTEEDPIFGPEVKTRLQTINEDDFPYYPLPSHASLPIVPVHEETKTVVNNDARPLVRRGVRAMRLRKYLKCVFRNYGIKRGN